MTTDVSPRSLPAGTVTFLFTDIGGSTELLKQLGEKYSQLLADQRNIIRAAFDQHQGREIDTQGDAFFASFARATDALAAVVDIQRALATHGWPGDVQVRVRMGLHTGEPWLVEEGYVGMDVHRAARVGHIGYGGQVLLSETTTALIRHDLPDGVTLLDLGHHLLKDMRRPEHIHQLVIKGLPSDFPPIKSLQALPASISAREIETFTKREVGPCPYRGLASFQEDDASFFFGREEFTELLEESVQTQNLVAVIVGPSGSGKSSVVSAGLLPKLKEEPGWLTVQIRPGGNPYLSLASAMTPILEGDSGGTKLMLESSKLAAALRDGEVTLSSLIERLLVQAAAPERFLLVVDQFEELFTLTQDSEERRAFLAELLETAGTGDRGRPSRFKLLLTLRADFMGQALAHRPFADALQDGSLMLGPMNREELQAAIKKPAELQGAAFETGLVERLLSDVGDEPGNLPLLEFALTLLWERMDMGWMTHAVYDEIGRVDGALARYAEEVYAGLNPRAQSQAHRAFIQLVQPGQGTEDTRRVATKTELVAVEWDLVQYLADKRLIVTGLSETGVGTVEVVHETLIRSWERLKDWIDADRSFRSWQEGLRSNMRQWEAADRDEGALLRGVRLAQAEEWLLSRSEELGPAEKEFIQASSEHNKMVLARRERRRRYIVAGLAVGLILALGLSAIALSQRSQAVSESEARATQQALAESGWARAEAESEGRATQQAIAESEWARAETESNARATQQAVAEEERARAEAAAVEIASQKSIVETQAREALARNLATSAYDNLNTDPQLGLLLALKAAEQTYSVDGSILPEAQGALYQAIQDVSRLSLAIPSQHNGIPYINFTADGSRLIARYFASGGDPRVYPRGTTTLIWDGFSGDLLHSLPRGVAVDGWPTTPYLGVVELLENELVLTLWDPMTGAARPPIHLPVPEGTGIDALTALILHPDGSTLYAFYASGRFIQVWDLETGVLVDTLPEWETDFSGNASRQVGGIAFFKTGVPSYMTISSDGQHIYSIHTYFGLTVAFTAQIFAIRDAQTAEYLSGKGVDSQDLGISYPGWTYSPDERMYAVIRHDRIEISEFTTQELLSVLLAPPGTHFSAVSFSPDNSMLATAAADGIIKIWDVSGLIESGVIRHSITLADPGSAIHDMAFSPDNLRLASAKTDGSIIIWSSEPGGGRSMPLLGRDRIEEGGAAVSIAISPDGKQIAIADPNGAPAVYDLESRERIFQLEEGQSEPVSQIGYTPDGATIVTCKVGGPFQIWDAANGDELFRLDEYTEGDCSFDYRSDGSALFLGFFKNEAGWHQEVALPELEPGNLIEMESLRSYEWLAPHEGASASMAYDDQSSSLAVVTSNGELFVWDTTVPIFGEVGGPAADLDPAESEALLARENRGYDEAVMDPAGKTLFVTSIAGSITLIDPKTGQAIRSIPAHDGRITAAALSADGNLLATGGLDRSIRVWDTETEEMLWSLSGQASAPSDLVFSPDGKHLYSASNDGTIRSYLLDVDELMALAQSLVSRYLTDEECRQYLHVQTCPTLLLGKAAQE